ncbi:MAG: erythromycin esterase family protein [Proteobacteria bacterium]|nr:erythromycin esterase family protein [Pseudomonadota bacterium]
MKQLLILWIFLFTSVAYGQNKFDFSSGEIYPIEGVDPSLPNEELTPLMTQIMNGTSILGIGENVHGSKHLLQMQQRLIQNAIEKQGVRTIFWETNLFATREINQYLLTCKGDLPSLLKWGRYWAFEDEINTLKWICQFNQTQKTNPVRIIGVDIYNYSELNHQWVIDKTSDTEHADQIKMLLDQTKNVCIGHGKSKEQYMEEIYAYYYKQDQISPINFEICNKRLNQVLKLLESNNRIAGVLTDLEYAEMRVYIRNLLASQWYWLNRFSLGDSLAGAWKPRARAMAENVIDFWNALGKPKSIFLAHTSHVAKFHAPFIQTHENIPAEKTQPIYPAGTYINAKLGSLYKVIGFTGYDNDGPQGDFLVPTSDKSLDLFIKNYVQVSVAWIDLKKGSRKFDRHWWLQHENGGKGAFKDGVWMNPVDHYDALIYVERSEVAAEVNSEPTVFEQLQKPIAPPSINAK